MKKCLILLALLMTGMVLSAFPVHITSWHIADDVKRLNELNITVDYVNVQTQTIIAYVHDAAELSMLISCGFIADQIDASNRMYANYICNETIDATEPQRAYLSIAEYTTFMQNTAAQYPNLCQLIQFGSSAGNRPLYFLKISDNVTVEENEPEFRYLSSMHGDEVVGYDMCIRLIQMLTSQYSTNSRVADIVNNTEIWICPMFNPDGYVAHSRYNNNGADLNRNYPMPIGSQHPDGIAWQPETIALMDHSNAQSINFSVNFHGGALVTNYPWDYTYTLTGDNSLYIQASLEYSSHNSPMYNSSEFDNGITNGAAWYIVEGSLQDWVYYNNGDMDLTIEIGETKWPAASSLDTYWSQNQESMLSLLEYVQIGVYGTVTNTSGDPLAANIHITNTGSDVQTDPEVGDFHRMLLPGNYTLTVSADGYQAATADVTISALTPTLQNFVLQPMVTTDFFGSVISTTGLALSGATVRITSGTSTYTALTNPQGAFILTGVPSGACTLQINAADYALYQSAFQLNAGVNPIIFVLTAPLFSDSYENGIANWTVQSPWAILTQNTNHVLTDSPSGNYSSNVSLDALKTSPVSLVNVSNATLTFDLKYALEPNYDFLHVLLSSNGNTWTELTSFTGTSNVWTNYSYSLAGYQGSNLYLKFRLTSDNAVTADGVYLDNIKISGFPTTQTVYGDTDSNWMINYQDMVNLVAYSVGTNLIEDADPSPWEDFRLEGADVDNDGFVTATDAYYIFTRLYDYSGAFPAQDGPVISFSDTGFGVSASGDSIMISAEHPENIKAMTFHFSADSNVNLSSFNPPFGSIGGIAYSNLTEGKISLLVTAGVLPLNIIETMQFTASGDVLHCHGAVNDQTINLDLNLTPNQDDSEIPPVTQLLGCYPNPFRTDTSIRFTLNKQTQSIRISIYNLRGQLVKSLVSEHPLKGINAIIFDGRDNHNRPLGNGIYYYRLESETTSLTGKLVLLK
jgi:hypothetical protein